MKPILILCLIIFSLMADDAIYKGDGATVFPISTDQIQMLHEKVVCTGGGLGWNVEMTATYKNFGPDTTVQIGFPFNIELPDEPDESGSKERYKVEFFDPHFETFINGKSVPVTPKHAKEHPELSHINFPTAYTFKVNFAINEEKTIRHTYTVGGSSSSVGSYSFSYILVTGALWKDKINLVEVEMRLTSNEGFAIISPKEDSCRFDENLDKTVLYWTYRDIEPDFDIEVENLPWFQRNETPGSNLKYLWSSIRIYDEPGIRYLRNLVFAYYGYPFKNPLIRNTFYASGLYSENENYSPEYISSYHQEFLKYLALIESKEEYYSREKINSALKEFPLLSSLNYPEVNLDSNLYLKTLEWHEANYTLDVTISREADWLIKKYGKLGLQYLRNLVYAHYGFPFKDPINREAFYYSGRFFENDHYSEEMMSAYHKEFLQKIIKMEQEYK